jgi:phage tail sheath protein FI
MPEYLSPGVYIEEIDSGPKPIEGVSTSTAAFVGFTEKVPSITKKSNGKFISEKALGRPYFITNWSQYQEKFGGFAEGAYLPYSVFAFFQNGGQRCYVLSVQEIPKAQKQLSGGLMVEAKNAGLDGTRIRVKLDAGEAPAPPKATSSPAKKGDDKGDSASSSSSSSSASSDSPSSFNIVVEHQEPTGDWKLVEELNEVTLAEVEDPKAAQKVKVAYKFNRPSQWIDIQVPETASLAKISLQSSKDWEQLEFPKTHQLPAPDSKALNGDVRDRTGIGGLESLDDVSIVCVPDLMSGQDGPDPTMVKAVQDAMVTHCELMGDRVAVLDPLPDLSPQEIVEWRMNNVPDSSYAALYYPWVEVMDPLHNRPIQVPPSGHVAGIWARSDSTRGVHKAPANEPVRFMTDLAINVTKREQDILNPIGINCIRTFPGRGTRVWGARTVSSNPSWRYLNVRRLFNFVEKSIERSTQWVVFEPNDHDLWARVTRDVRAFLRVVWRSGALFGLTEDAAFYVKCDEELNPPESRDLGRLVIEIAMAPVKPAEFVIFRIMQKNEYAD